jgi:hypothetical protein
LGKLRVKFESRVWIRGLPAIDSRGLGLGLGKRERKKDRKREREREREREIPFDILASPPSRKHIVDPCLCALIAAVRHLSLPLLPLLRLGLGLELKLKLE